MDKLLVGIIALWPIQPKISGVTYSAPYRWAVLYVQRLPAWQVLGSVRPACINVAHG